MRSKGQAMEKRILLCLAFSASLSWAHEKGAPFSAAIIDPLEVHHAHIEDEQRINLFFRNHRKSQEDGEAPTDVFMNNYEMAWASKDFRFGAETIIPFAKTKGDDGETSYGLGDIEIRPLKYAWLNSHETVFTTSLGILVPTGSERKGLGEGRTLLEPQFFLDKAYRNWYLGVNIIPSVAVTGDSQSLVEWGGVLSYSFLSHRNEPVPSFPQQPTVWSTSLEVLGDTGISGTAKEEKLVSLLPGITLWLPRSGWQFHAGVKLPVANIDGETKIVLFQIGNHVDWGRLLGLKRNES